MSVMEKNRAKTELGELEKTPTGITGLDEVTGRQTGGEKYVLRLYVTGITPRSTTTIENIQNICERHLKGRYELEIIDVYQQPVLAKGEQIIAAPTLVKKLPLPLRRFIGDMSQTEKILLGLDLRQKKPSTRQGQTASLGPPI
jgi:circadian clock protein KaiB